MTSNSDNNELESDMPLRDPYFGLRINRLPPTRRLAKAVDHLDPGRIKDPSSNSLKAFKIPGAGSGIVQTQRSVNGVLRQKAEAPAPGGRSQKNATPEFRPETPLEGAANLGRPDGAPTTRSEFLKGDLRGFRRSTPHPRPEGGA